MLFLGIVLELIVLFVVKIILFYDMMKEFELIVCVGMVVFVLVVYFFVLVNNVVELIVFVKV